MSTIARHLERALALEDLDAARHELLAAWELAPQERLAKLVEAADAKRDAVLPAGLMNLGTQAAAKATAALSVIVPDPRVAIVALDLLAKPPWRSLPALPFWRACLERIVHTRDPRILVRLEAVALGYPKTIPTSVGVKVGALVNRAVIDLEGAIAAVRELDDRSREAAEALEARLGVKAPKRSLGVDIVEELLQAVYETPADDAPRLVLADHLMQRNDPRGEFISLQLQRASGRSDEDLRARELQLLEASKGQWTGRIGMAFEPSRFVFRRGFVAHALIPRRKGTMKQFADDPAWHTFESLNIAWYSIIGDDRALLLDLIERSRGLVALSNVPARVLADLSDAALAKLERIEHVEVGSPKDMKLVTRWLGVAKRARRLGLRARPRRVTGAGGSWRTEIDLAELDPLLASPHFPRLESLMLDSEWTQGWLLRFEPTALPSLVLQLRDVRLELIRKGSRFTRAQVMVQSTTLYDFPRRTVQMLTDILGDRAIEYDPRAPFYPGMKLARAPSTGPNVGFDDDLANLP